MSLAQEQVRLSERLALLQPSATVGLGARLNAMRAEGVAVISFAQGEPDFATPVAIKAAATEAILRDRTKYTPAGGIVPLREAIARRVTTDTGITYTANQITVTSGVKEGLFLTMLAVCNAGDEVIIPAPYWVSYVEQVRMASATPVVVNTDEQTSFKLTPDQLAASLTVQTRVVVLGSPCNPTGAVYTAEELAGLAEVLRAHTRAYPENPVLVLTDEIYDQICYSDYARWLRVAPDMAEQTVVFNGLSKTYAMTGWRVGYAAGPEHLLKAIRAMQSHSTTHTASIAQYAALCAYTPSDELDAQVVRMAAAFRERRDLILSLLAELPDVPCTVPDGAFYVFPNVSSLLNRPLANGTTCTSSMELAEYLLEAAHIGVVPGEAFGTPGYVRISYATDSASIREGLARFKRVI